MEDENRQTNRLNFGAQETEQTEQEAPVSENNVETEEVVDDGVAAQEEAQTAEAEAQPEAVVEEVDGQRTDDAPAYAGEPESNDAYQATGRDMADAAESDQAEQDADLTREEAEVVSDATVADVAAANEAVLDETADAVGDNGGPVAEAYEGLGNETLVTGEDEAPRVEIAAAESDDEASVADLKSKQADIEARIAAKQQAEKRSVMEQIKTVVDNYGITTNDLVEFLGGYKAKRNTKPVQPKYRNPVDNKTWSGRGRVPAWLKDQDRSKFLIV